MPASKDPTSYPAYFQDIAMHFQNSRAPLTFHYGTEQLAKARRLALYNFKHALRASGLMEMYPQFLGVQMLVSGGKLTLTLPEIEHEEAMVLAAIRGEHTPSDTFAKGKVNVDDARRSDYNGLAVLDVTTQTQGPAPDSNIAIDPAAADTSAVENAVEDFLKEPDNGPKT